MAKVTITAFTQTDWKKYFSFAVKGFIQEGFMLKELRYPKAFNDKPVHKTMKYRKVKITIEEVA